MKTDFEKYVELYRGIGLRPTIQDSKNGGKEVTVSDGDGGEVVAYFGTDGKFSDLVILG